MIGIERILQDKRAEIASLGNSFPKRARPRFSFRGALARPGLSVIAEIKRSSPSTGPLGAEPMRLRDAYVAGKADALSILTDRHFGMAASDLAQLAADVAIPVLRKDFILSEAQIREADSIGADAILLIATFLEAGELVRLGRCAEEIGLDVLYEAHSAEDLAKIPASARIVGINNRNLSAGSYETDRALCEILRDRIPPGAVKVAESGFTAADQIPPGFDAVLIGTGLIREFTRGGDVGALIGAMKRRAEE